MEYFNLVLAVCWMVLAVVLLLGDRLGWRSPLGDASWLGMLALLLAFYNLVRWWSTRSYTRQRRALEEAERHREAAKREAQRSNEPVGEPDPNFNFTAQRPDPRNSQPFDK